MDPKEAYRVALANAMTARDAAVADAGTDEDARKGAIAAFDEWDAGARAARAAALAQEDE